MDDEDGLRWSLDAVYEAQGEGVADIACIHIPSAKCREVLGESHEGWAASYYQQEPLAGRVLLHMDDSVEWIDLFSGMATSLRDGGEAKGYFRRHTAVSLGWEK